MPSIESQAAEAAYLILINPEAERQAEARPELILYWMQQMVPRATLEQIGIAMQVAAELAQADIAEMKDQFQRGTLVLPDSVFAEI